MKGKSVTLFLSVLALLIGIWCLFSGIRGAAALRSQSRDYETAEGYLYDYEIYSEGGYDPVKKKHTNDTYRLIYQFQVEGYVYLVSTDMGVGVVPEPGSSKTVYYNPLDPTDAFLAGPNSHAFKIFFGLFFIAIPSFFLWILMPEKKKADKRPKKTSIDSVGAVIGFVFMFFSYGMLFFMTGEYSLAGIINFYRTSFFFPMVIPILMIAAGGFLFVKSIFAGKQEKGSQERKRR